jgi:uncharacterized membrane protein YhhN
MGPGPFILLCALAVVGLLAAERRGSQRGKWIAKPVASLAFVGAALAAGALDGDYGRWILLGLVLCLLGDLLLIPLGRPAVFRAGIFAFLSGHLAYAVAFVGQPLDAAWLAVATLLIAFGFWRIWKWLAPHVAAMRVPVVAYFAVIGLMTALACGVTGAGGPASVALGAVAFTASDISVARDRFVQHDFYNRAWGLPLYYCAQLLLASSVAQVAG